MRHLEIHERCLRAKPKNDQLWGAYALHRDPFKLGPTVYTHSRKSVRSAARTGFTKGDSVMKKARRGLGFFILAHTPIRRLAWWLTRP